MKHYQGIVHEEYQQNFRRPQNFFLRHFIQTRIFFFLMSQSIRKKSCITENVFISLLI